MKTNVGNNEGLRKVINKVGVVVDLAEQTVSFAGYVAHTENVDAAIVFFGVVKIRQQAKLTGHPVSCQQQQ